MDGKIKFSYLTFHKRDIFMQVGTCGIVIFQLLRVYHNQTIAAAKIFLTTIFMEEWSLIGVKIKWHCTKLTYYIRIE